MFTLTIRTDNDAFHDPDTGDFSPELEVADILQRIVARVLSHETTGKYQTIHDSNGNDVGRFKLTEEDA